MWYAIMKWVTIEKNVYSRLNLLTIFAKTLHHRCLARSSLLLLDVVTKFKAVVFVAHKEYLTVANYRLFLKIKINYLTILTLKIVFPKFLRYVLFKMIKMIQILGD